MRNALGAGGHGRDAAVPGCGCMQSARVKEVYQIENFHQWQMYKTKLTALQQDHAKYNVQAASSALDVENSRNEKILSSAPIKTFLLAEILGLSNVLLSGM